MKMKPVADAYKSIEIIKTFIYKDFIKNNYTVCEGLAIIGCIASHIILQTSLEGEDPEKFKQCLFKAIEDNLKGC